VAAGACVAGTCVAFVPGRGAVVLAAGASVGRTGVSVGRPGVSVGRTGVSVGRPGVSVGRTVVSVGRPGVSVGRTVVSDVGTVVSVGRPVVLVAGTVVLVVCVGAFVGGGELGAVVGVSPGARVKVAIAVDVATWIGVLVASSVEPLLLSASALVFGVGVAGVAAATTGVS